MVFPSQGPATEELSVGTLVAQKYRIERLLGHGGMGNVYLALHAQLGRRVAIKTLRAQALAMADLRARFRREAMAAANLHSEHIAQVIDLGELPDGSPFMVMEYLEGQDLAATLQQRGPLPVAEVVDYLRQACAGVAVAHAAGIVHRDLKPANLFLVPRPGSTPLLKVLDFGIAKAPLLVSSIHTQIPVGPAAARTSLTQTDTVLGSLRYMAPEQIASARDVDARADIWSLGVIAHRLLTGRYPFAGDQLHEIYLAATRSRPAPLNALRPDVPPALAQIVDTCLQPEPDRRWASVATLQQALGSVPAPPSAPWAPVAPTSPPAVTGPHAYTMTGPHGFTASSHGAVREPTFVVPSPATTAPRPRVPLAAMAAGAMVLVAGTVVLTAFVARGGIATRRSVASAPGLSPHEPSLDSVLPPGPPLPVADARHVDPLELLPLAKARALALEPTATLDGIDVSHAQGGRVDLTDKENIILFHFRYVPRSKMAVNVMFFLNRLHLAERSEYGSASFASASVEPRCSLTQAWNAVVRAGKTPRAGGSATYTRSHAYHETWAIAAVAPADDDYVVNGQTCVLEGTSSSLPASAFESSFPPATAPGRRASPATTPPPAPATAKPLAPATTTPRAPGRATGSTLDPWSSR